MAPGSSGLPPETISRRVATQRNDVGSLIRHREQGGWPMGTPWSHSSPLRCAMPR